MFLKVIFLAYFFTIYASNGAVLLWSNNKLQISPLSNFNDDTLQDLIEKLGYPEVNVYKSPFGLLPSFEQILSEYHRAYNPNGDVNTENATEITGEDDLTLLETKQRLDLSRGENILSVLVLPNSRQKREATGSSSTTESPTNNSKGPVLYRAMSNKGIYSMLYSSRPLILHAPLANYSNVEIRDSLMVTVDTPSRESKDTRLYVKVKVVEENITDLIILQFFFAWTKSYWFLSTVKITSTNANFSVNLSITEPFLVRRNFSYHCSGVTVFSDSSKTTDLHIYDLQAQTDSKNGDFSDAYDCIDFTTVPIWSGIFVTAFLGVGMIIALIAITEIKTMDKFDNQKTKQLAITVAE